MDERKLERDFRTKPARNRLELRADREQVVLVNLSASGVCLCSDLTLSDGPVCLETCSIERRCSINRFVFVRKQFSLSSRLLKEDTVLPLSSQSRIKADLSWWDKFDSFESE